MDEFDRRLGEEAALSALLKVILATLTRLDPSLSMQSLRETLLTVLSRTLGTVPDTDEAMRAAIAFIDGVLGTPERPEAE